MNMYLYLIVGAPVLAFFVESITDYLNLKSYSTHPPSEFASLVTNETLKKSYQYLKTNTHFRFVKNITSLTVFILFLFWGGFETVDQLSRSLSTSFGVGTTVTGLIFVALLSTLSFITSLPFGIYHTFVIEERFGFNKTTLKTYILDIIKGVFIGALIGAPLFAGLIFFFETFEALAWLYAWIGITIFQILITFLAPALIMPLFNKFESLPDGELKSAILEYIEKHQFQLSGVFVMDGSKRSSKANAFFTGFGKFRKLVFFDTLISKHSTTELVAVLAHEIGHFKCRHILKMTVLSILVTGLMLFTFSFFINNKNLFDAFGVTNISIYGSLIFISILYSPLSGFLSVFTNSLSRKHEFEADTFAAKTYKRPEELISALKKLSVDQLSHLTPHPLKVILDYSHPPVLKRIENLRNIK